MKEYTYTGNELELFSQAKNWKNYVRSLIKEYVRGDVLEVGAGIGSNTILFRNVKYKSWFCLEPDSNLAETLEYSISSHKVANCYTQNGTIESLENSKRFDLILYIDVMEHIYDDKTEMLRACHRLNPGGNIVVLSPAHQWLFTPFDASIGHHRRYTKKTLKHIIPDVIEVTKFAYLDCVGLLASLGNKLILNQSQPTLKQIQLWDNVMVPLSRKLDPVISYSLGKSILLVGRRNE